jgi:hypothetical protein
MSAATRTLAHTIRRTAHDVADRKPETQLAVVRKASPIEAELTTSRQKLTDDDLEFGQAVRRYDRDTGIKKGDTLVVCPMRNGDWIIVEVLGEGDPKVDEDTKEAAEKDAAARVKVEEEARKAAITAEENARKALEGGNQPVILVRATTTAALPANTLTGNVLEKNTNGALAAQDGVSLAVGDRLLVKNEAEGKKNGVYEVTSLGAAGAKWKLTRIASMDSSAEVVPGMNVVAAEGTQNGGVTLQLLTTGAITLNTTALTFGYAGAWIEPTLTNWKNYESGGFPKIAYRKTRDGRVVLRGLGQPTALGQNVMFNLPAGFRPSSPGANGPGFATVAGNGAGDILSRLEIQASGNVLPGFSAGGTTGVYYQFLDGISFYID